MYLSQSLSSTAHSSSQQQIAADGMSEAQCLHMVEQLTAEVSAWGAAAQAAAVLDLESGGPGETLYAQALFGARHPFVSSCCKCLFANAVPHAASSKVILQHACFSIDGLSLLAHVSMSHYPVLLAEQVCM